MIFKRLSVVKNCLRPESAPLSKQVKKIHGGTDLKLVFSYLRDCNYIQEELNSNHFAGVVVNIEYFCTNSDRIMQNIHTVKQVKGKVLKESTWFQRTKNCRSPLSLTSLQPKTQEESENFLFNGIDGRFESLANPR